MIVLRTADQERVAGSLGCSGFLWLCGRRGLGRIGDSCKDERRQYGHVDKSFRQWLRHGGLVGSRRKRRRLSEARRFLIISTTYDGRNGLTNELRESAHRILLLNGSTSARII